MPLHKRLYILYIRGLTNQVGDVQGKEVTRLEKSSHRLQIDVVRIQKIRLGPAKLLDRGIGGSTRLARLRSNNHVLTVRLVPHRNHLNPGIGGQNTRRKLRLCLMRKPIPHAQ